MKTTGKLNRRMFLAFVSTTLFLLALGSLTAWMLLDQKKITAAQERRYQSYLLADELRQSSDDLTRLARTYVVTGDPRYEQQYWAVLDIRNGKIPRPEQYQRIYWDFMAVDGSKPRPDGSPVALRELMKMEGFTEGEFAKLEQAQANSDGLVHIETIAMNAVKGLFDDGHGGFTKKGEPDLELARRLMHSAEYHAEKAKIMKPIDDFFVMLDQRTSREVQVLVQRNYRLFYALLSGVVLAILALAGFWFSIFQTVIRPIQRAMGDLSETGHQLDQAAAQLAVANQSLSSGASEQAASVEETGASLEEMSSMIQATAENAQKAKASASETRQAEENGSRTMGELVAAMKEIDSSTTQVSKIVKDIDEIAFQTNILALNAAVEAARAGEAGAGFAVVADEVRSLAQRSAAAAKETARKIETAIDSSRKGTHCTMRVGELLEQIARKVAETDALVGEIATASQEQAQGIEQINQAIGQIDKISQGNASNAEQTAAAAEQVETQGAAINEQVGRLRELVGGDAEAGRTEGLPRPGVAGRSTLFVHAEMDPGQSLRKPKTIKPQIEAAQRKKLASGDSDGERNFRNF